MSTTEKSASASTASLSARVEELCSYLRRGAEPDPELLCRFARDFFGRVPRQMLQERGVEALAEVARATFRFLERARPDRVNVEVAEPEEGEAATVVRALVSDRPFVVDTMREYLAEETTILHFVHPVLRVARGADGRITALDDPAEGQLEALVHAELAPVHDAERRERIRRELERRLADVVAATDDFQAMLAAVGDTTERVRGYARLLPARADEFAEIADFLEWLREGNFVLLGCRAYGIVESAGEPVLRVEPGSGLGILRHEEHSAWARGVPLGEVAEELRRRVVGGPALVIDKTNARATVHRRSRMDYIGVKRLDAGGRVVGEDRFLGLFTSRAYDEHAEAIPILRHKLERILLASGAPPGSHDYKEIITIFNSMPKEELFQASVEEIEGEVQAVLALLFANQVKVVLRPDPLGRGVGVMVLLPRGKFSGEIRQRVQETLARRLEGEVLNYHLAMSGEEQARLYFYLSAPRAVVEAADPEAIEGEIAQIIRSWDERLRDRLAERYDEEEAERLARLYAPAFHDDYRAIIPPAAAVYDLERLERMWAEGSEVAVALRAPVPGEGGGLGEVTILNLYLRDARLVLSDFMPTLEHAGMRVIEVTPYLSTSEKLPSFTIYSFVVQTRDGGALPLERAGVLAEALLAIRRGDTPDDAFNVLVLRAGLRWREVDVLRAYANYAFQIGAVPTRSTAARALDHHPALARRLVELFQARFDPERQAAGQAGTDHLRAAIAAELEAVDTLADDRALRRLLALVEGTTRTNYFRTGAAEPTARSGGVPYLSLKFRCAAVEELRRNGLLYEVFVYSSRMEGIHLRAAPVSRGGIRWSDRTDDYRTEVLGLVRTQIVKNAVIVPSGSKGGFITKRHLPEREAMLHEAAEQYRTLMRGLLDITDNLVEGAVAPPPGVVRHDGDDPYLVVAADKGTAHLSDVANAVSAEYGFWLGDAFASGGSHGYDHKEEGITARGAWECVRRHFREMGKDIQAEPFTVAGVGDMSGDVFGNGMLLSRQIRLVAAFDHRHVFIDPDPDPAASFEERARLFALPRSSWDDYDRGRLSPGAMIVARASKEVELTPEARAALGVHEAVQKLDGEALVRAVLTAPVELLWNGGIGTYVKDRDESNAEVGDPANDPVRVDAQALRCRVVGEGGNLGFTQRARIAFSLAGGHIDTDALDNSGGVDMSDHEVNLKILLNPMVAAGAMSFEARNELLAAMTDEVSHLVLHDNVHQSLAVSLDEARSRETLGDFAALVTALERDRVLDRAANGIPGVDEIQARAREGLGLTRPTLCVLLALAKLQAGARLLGSALPDDPATEGYLVGYFPPQAVEAAGMERLRRHRLRREIITTCLVSDLVDLMGSSFLHRLARDTGQELDAVARAWFIASRISGAHEIRADLERLEAQHPAQTVYRWYFGLARVLERTTRWILNNVDPAAPAAGVIEEHHAGLAQLRGEFTRIVAGEDRALFQERMRELQELGIEPDLSARLITLRFLPELLDILRIALEAGTDAVQTARAYYLVSEQLAFSWLRQALRGLGQEDVWEKRLAGMLVADVGRAQRAVAHALLDGQAPGQSLEQRLRHFEAQRARELQLYREALDELRQGEQPPLAGYAVAVRTLGEVAG